MASSDLRITGVSVDVIAWPLKMKRRHGVGDIERSMPGAILRITTDGGLVGWGEVAPWAVFTGTAEANATGIAHYLKPILIGADPLRVSSLMQKIEKALTGHTEGKAAIEMALLDITGKRFGLSIAQLLGGRYRERVPLSVSIANPDFDADLEFARHVASLGVNIFKVKTGFLTHAEDMKRLERLRSTLAPTADIRIDYNQGLDPWNALQQVREMEVFKPTFIEQPVKRHQWEAMAEIARAIDTPLMADESVFSPADAIAMVRQRFADVVAIKIMKSGGIARAREIAAIAEAAGIIGYGGTMFEGGIASAAGLQMVSATPNIALGAEFYTSTWVMGVEVLTKPLQIENGQSVVPDGPGLGVEVDEDAVKSISVAHYA
ncbi:cycloisomerase [Roseomonas hellenica]|uniref:Cycloisomerase n=1 Tax=Plastoroseomonas hellenica TaxID=2687306 RepID=A0ABS5EY54_9PROT|nr:cycloisomerase [Plastoroseomonas hellenica]